tara:strand:- start:49 stop:519 length:471 start_codon:yes stop_codon:yes gene_type:complete
MKMLQQINLDKKTIQDIKKYYNKVFKDSNVFTEEIIQQEFIQDIERYIKASKENRLIANVRHVSKSGMYRVIDILEFGIDINVNRDEPYHGYIRSFVRFFGILDNYNLDKSGVVVRGCGMDMIFALHNNIIETLFYRGLISESDRQATAQNKPYPI